MIRVCLVCFAFITLVATHASASPVLWVDLTGKNIHITLGGGVLRTWPIAGPKRVFTCIRNKHTVTGTVVSIDPNASWVPTEKTRRARAAKGITLKPRYAPTDPKNALAGRKISVRWHACTEDLNEVRIHGTVEPALVRKRASVSRGCIRMLNADWDALAALIRPGMRVVLSLGPPH